MLSDHGEGKAGLSGVVAAPHQLAAPRLEATE